VTVAFVFGGQGTEVPRMGLELAEHVPRAAELLARAGGAAGVDPGRVLAGGGPDFQRTAVIQPLLVAVGLGAVAAVAVKPAFVAGHSLGELAAWAASGAITAEDAIALAAVRGRIMQREAAAHPGAMVAVAGDESRLAAALALGRSFGSVVVAAHNAPGEWTVSGDERALAAIVARFGASRLPVSGAWHSPAMARGVDEFAAAARALGIRPAIASIIANRTGDVAAPAAMVELLAGQLVRPVEWAKTLATLAAHGVTRIVTFGPSKLMRSLVVKNLGTRVRVHAVETFADARSLT
jgi:[acyl-carrier-protein] S-malonyltransferase